MGKRLMTLSDLYNYYSKQGITQNFSCEGNGDTIVVRTDGKLNFSKDNSKDGMLPARVQINFIGDNLNGSRIKLKAQEAALPSSHYRPILGYIHEVDGKPQFKNHTMHQDENGDIVYDERPVGVFCEEAHIEHDDEYDMDYAVANGYIWEEYSKAGEIITRDGQCNVSAELTIRSLSYDAKDKILNLDDFYYSGATILGLNEDGSVVNPAMPGSNITLQDFSRKDEIKDFSTDEKLISMLEKLNTTLSHFNNQRDFMKGGKNQVFEELLSKYNKTVDDIKFDYSNMSDEELEVAFAEAFEDLKKTDDTPATPVDEPEENPQPQNLEPEDDEPTPAPEGGDEPEEQNGDSTEGEGTETFKCGGSDDDKKKKCEDEDEDDDDFACGDKKKKCSVEFGDTKKEFSVSMNAKLEALSNLVNDTYSDDMTWYCCEVYDDDKYVVMIDCWNGKAYKQSYKCKDDVFSLKGDRVEVYSTWMTRDEQKAFEDMKSRFSVIEEKLNKYESEPKKVEILNSAKYGYIAETEEFAELKKEENHFNMSVEEVTAKANEILLSYAEQGKLKFADDSENQNKVGNKKFATSSKKSSRYGNLFSK